MLYDRWRKVVQERRNEIALRDISAGQRWTFSELAAATESPLHESGSIVYPQGNSAQFILSVLRAWRSGAVVCPLEAGQKAPPSTKPSESCIHLKTTSATTGAPRLIAFTGEQLAADADNIVATMGLRPDWPNLGLISLAHSYGFSNLVLPLLLHGIPLTLAPGHLPDMISRVAAQESHWTVAGVPVLWRAWHQAHAIPSNIRLAISAGAPLTSALEQKVFETVGLKIHNFYGASECGGIAYDGSALPRKEDALVGSPLQQVSLSVADSGCLQVQSAAVGESYWPEADQTLGGGRFQTSDLAEITGGLVYLRGRMGDLINVAGRKVSAEAIERAIAACPEVRECLVFSVSIPEWQRSEREHIVACVAAEPSVTPEQLKQLVSSQLPAWQVPKAWWFVNELSANQRGKISRAEWKKEYLKSRGATSQ